MMTTRYFFGYYCYHGLWWPTTWPEEGGVAVGIRPVVASHNLYEISEEEFNKTLQELVKKYPQKEDDPSTPETG
jgi:hypothetical protein